VHYSVVWEKFKALRQGADLASKQLWGAECLIYPSIEFRRHSG